MYIRFSACLIYAYANLSIGKIQRARYALEQVKDMLSSSDEASAENRVAGAFINVASAVLLHLPLPEGMPSSKDFLPALPPGVRAFALYVQAHYLYLKKNMKRVWGRGGYLCHGSAGISDTGDISPPGRCHGYMSLRQKERAEEHMLAHGSWQDPTISSRGWENIMDFSAVCWKR